MGIYIKGAELPTSCRSCPHEIGGDCYGGKAKYIKDVDDNEEQFRNSRHPDCPLIYIPEPHGRLIDGDKLFDDEKLCYGVECSECQFLYKTENFLESCCKVERMIYNAPTVIEGSE